MKLSILATTSEKDVEHGEDIGNLYKLNGIQRKI